MSKGKIVGLRLILTVKENFLFFSFNMNFIDVQITKICYTLKFGNVEMKRKCFDGELCFIFGESNFTA